MNTQLSVRKAITVLHVMAMNGLRKNLKVSNPSTGASFHAPPNALNHPPALASRSTAHFGVFGYVFCSHVTVQMAAMTMMITAIMTDQRTARLWIGLPKAPNCMG